MIDRALREGFQEGYSIGYDDGYRKGFEEGVSEGFQRGHGRTEFIKVKCPFCKESIPYPIFKGPFSLEIYIKDEFLQCPTCKSPLPKRLILDAYSRHKLG